MNRGGFSWKRFIGISAAESCYDMPVGHDSTDHRLCRDLIYQKRRML